jgi:hypothetical protein
MPVIPVAILLDPVMFPLPFGRSAPFQIRVIAENTGRRLANVPVTSDTGIAALTRLDGTDFEEVFELAEADKPFEVCSRARLKRVK